MQKKIKYTVILGAMFVMAVFPLFFSDNYPQLEQGENFISVYFFDNTINYLVSEQRVIPSQYTTLESVTFVLDQMYDPPAGLYSVLGDVRVLNYSIHLDDLLLSLSQDYMRLPAHEELMARVGLVYTFAGLYPIENIRIYVGGGPLLSPLGVPLGNLNMQNTIRYPILDPYAVTATTISVSLYFVDPSLFGLYYQRIIMSILSDISTEEQVLEELFNRAHSGFGLLFLSPSLRILGVDVIEDIAYIDLSYHFDNAPSAGAMAQLLTIYAIVNTITGLNPDIKEIEFLIEGQKITEHMGYIDLNPSFVRNEDLLLNAYEEIYE